MTALTTDRDTKRKPGLIGYGGMAASLLIYGGAAVCHNASGYLVKGADTAGLVFAGIAKDRFDNSSGAAGDLTAEFERDGEHLFTLGTAATDADVGKKVFLVDDQTVDLEEHVDNNVFAGVLTSLVTSTMAYVDIKPAVGKTDVFDVPVILADPGDAGAIKVSQSGNCAITTAGAETRTLAAPARAGIRLAVTLDVDGGNCVITAAAAINQTGNNTITMADAGDTIVLEGVQVGGANVWRTIVNDGCTLSTV